MNEMSNGKMLYAYLKVMDPNTSLPKSVLINWVCTIYLFVCLFSFRLYVFVYTYIVGICLLVFYLFCLVSIFIGHYSVIINWSILFYRVEGMFLPL